MRKAVRRRRLFLVFLFLTAAITAVACCVGLIFFFLTPGGYSQEEKNTRYGITEGQESNTQDRWATEFNAFDRLSPARKNFRLNQAYGLALPTYPVLQHISLLQPYSVSVPSDQHSKTWYPSAMPLMPLPLMHENYPLKQQLTALFDRRFLSQVQDRYTPHVFFFDPQHGEFVNINGYSTVSAASVIKLPVLFDAMLLLENNIIHQEQPLLYATQHQASGSGGLQYSPPGQTLALGKVLQDMIRFSDNTCTNIAIEYQGGMSRLNDTWQAMGLNTTAVRSPLPDLKGTNTISAFESSQLLYNMVNTQQFSEPVKAYGLDILKQTRNRSLLAGVLPKSVEVAHKTGNIGTVLGDAGVFFLPDGRYYILSMFVERPFNDQLPPQVFRDVSRLVYRHVKQQVSRPDNTADWSPNSIQ
ncbi:MAG: serine hydrolase [Cyanobacteria bacterium P01_H01_bin.74]